MIHVDGDLYQSAIDALVPCFKKNLISEGALIFFDDFDCNRAARGRGERKAWSDLINMFKIEFSDRGSYARFGHSFIVHAYQANSADSRVINQDRQFVF